MTIIRCELSNAMVLVGLVLYCALCLPTRLVMYCKKGVRCLLFF